MKIMRLLALLILCSCSFTKTIQLRGTEEPIPAITLEELEQRKPVQGRDGTLGCSDTLMRKQSIEHFVDGHHGQFSVGVIELSDDGHVKDADQEEKVLHDFEDVADSENGAVLVTFVHGWHHRPKVCDNNFACFRRVLRAVNAAEPNRPVYGVYIGWRGDSIKAPLDALSFYDRKSTAHHIGHDGGREVILRLDDIYKRMNRKHMSGSNLHPVSMVTVGHSFGGALVFSAVEAALVREFRTVHGVGHPLEAGASSLPVRPGIGDLVVLVNPAFEASRYAIFDMDLQNKTTYSDDQMPVLLTAASENDRAVKYAFPAGRTLYFLFHPWQRPSMSDIIGAGHYDPQTTHNLIVTDLSGKEIHPASPSPQTRPARATDEVVERCKLDLDDGDLATCECEYDVAASLDRQLGETTFVSRGVGTVQTGEGEQVELLLRDPKRNWDPHTPFIVARVSPSIVPKHSDIYTPRFVTFLAGYIHDFLKEAKKHEPAPSAAAAAAATTP